MCLSKAFLDKNGDKELLLDEVASLKVEGENLVLRTLFGEEKELKGRVREVDFMKHTILLDGVEKAETVKAR